MVRNSRIGFYLWIKKNVFRYDRLIIKEVRKERNVPVSPRRFNCNSRTRLFKKYLQRYLNWLRYELAYKNFSFFTYRLCFNFYKNFIFLGNRFSDLKVHAYNELTYQTFNRPARFFLLKHRKTFLRFIHPYHIVNPSPWPFFVSFGVFFFLIGVIQYLHSFFNYSALIKFGLFLTIFSCFCWWRDVIREGTYEGFHTKAVQKGLRVGMLLFIASEVMFFFAFFWAFFHSSLSPAIEIGGIWPPLGITVLDPWKMPLLNTMYLLASGAWITWAHHELSYPITNKKELANYIVFSRRFSEKKLVSDLITTESAYHNVFGGIFGTIAFGMLFTFTQWGEYDEALFNISDSIYGSIFYMATGFHGVHVLIGTTFLLICLIRYSKHHFTRQHHVGFEAAAWYWHFVDVVWLFLYICVYHWGG